MYINTKTQEQLSYGQIKRAHPNTAFPRSGPDDAWLAENGYARLTQTPKPDAPAGKRAVMDGVEEVNSEWRTKWAFVDIPKKDFTQKLLDIRYQKENGGVEVNGMTVQTNRESRADILAVRISAQEDSNYTVRWKTDTGFVTLDAQTILAVSDTVRNHVQACFEAEETVQNQIESGTITDLSEIEQAFNTAYEAT